jgi:alcohol dehydrogenase
MQLGSCLAGLAIKQSMLGATHALANPLTTQYSKVHRQASGLLLPHINLFNRRKVKGWHHELLEYTVGENGVPHPGGGVDALADFLASLRDKAGLSRTLSDCGVECALLPRLAADAARQWTGPFNPRSVNEANLLELYEAAF